MRTTGRTLEGFLNRFGYTIDPDGSRQYAYSTDLVRCVPLKPDQRGGRMPLPREIENCSPFLDEEIALLKPRVVILMGRHSTQAFFRRYLGQTVVKLADVAGGRHDAIASGVSLSAFAVPHPSPLVPMKAERQTLYRRVATDVAALLSAG
jgi:DNA polymerase